jgi:hypothetical protein
VLSKAVPPPPDIGKSVNLTQTRGADYARLVLETELDDHEDTCDEIWAEKLAYEQEIDELLLKRELTRQLLMKN